MESSESSIATQDSVDYENEIVLTDDEITSRVQDSAPKARKVRPTVRHRPGDSRRLRHRIVAIDLSAAIISWAVGTLLVGIESAKGSSKVTYFLVGLLAYSSMAFVFCFLLQLYRTRISIVPSVERLRVLVAAIGVGIFGGLIQSGSSGEFSVPFSIVAGVSFFIFCALFRSLFRQWLRIQRTRGRFHREILLVGTNSDANAMYELLRTHPEVGYTIVGVIGDKDESILFDDIAWCGPIDSVVEAVRKTGATGVVIASNALEPSQLRHVTNKLLDRSVHVHVSSGLFGFDERRLRPQSFSREPVFYIEPLSFPIFQNAIKRFFDIVVSSILIIFTSPIIAIAAIFIKLDDRGPVFFHQTRIGKNSKPFRCIKLRTMSVDAEKNLSKVMKQNERHGPLFKHSDDPRRTRIGKILEATSLDELPQLWLVLGGTMSLIGPRPALPHEVAVFDEDLNARHLVRPGITGLWQVEGRDNPSFDAYRRLDLFYVENWSLLLDLSIIAMTFHVVASRAFRTIFSRKKMSASVATQVDSEARFGE